MWECSYGRAREPPGVPILAYLREMMAGGSTSQRKSSFLSKTTENCRWQGSAFRHERQQFQARCHHLCGQKRQYGRKIKPLSSWKRRFQITSDGKYLRKQKGKRHKSFSKSRAAVAFTRFKLVHKSSCHLSKRWVLHCSGNQGLGNSNIRSGGFTSSPI